MRFLVLCLIIGLPDTTQPACINLLSSTTELKQGDHHITTNSQRTVTLQNCQIIHGQHVAVHTPTSTAPLVPKEGTLTYYAEKFSQEQITRIPTSSLSTILSAYPRLSCGALVLGAGCLWIMYQYHQLQRILHNHYAWHKLKPAQISHPHQLASYLHQDATEEPIRLYQKASQSLKRERHCLQRANNLAWLLMFIPWSYTISRGKKLRHQAQKALYKIQHVEKHLKELSTAVNMGPTLCDMDLPKSDVHDA